MSMTFDLRGFTALQNRLNALSKEDATKAGQSANRAGAAFLLKAVKANAPVGPDASGSKRKRHTKQGKVREETHHKIVDSLKVRKVRSDKQHTVENMITAGKAYHASMVEFGSIHNAPNPFMRKSMEENQQGIIEAMSKALNKNLTRRGV